MGKFSLKCFGVGDGWPCADRYHASFLYRLGKHSILIDCGDTLSRNYKASGLSYDALDRIFISHLHSDHTGGFFMFMQGLWLEHRTKPLPISLPHDGIKPIQQMLSAGLIFPELMGFEAKFEALHARRPVRVGGVRVTPFHTSHLDQLRKAFQKRYPQRFESFCFLIEAGRLRLAHSADIGRPDDLEPLLQKPLDVLVCELSHFQPEDLFRYLKGRDIKRIVFMHLSRFLWDNLTQTKRLAARMLPGVSCVFPRDNDEIAL